MYVTENRANAVQFTTPFKQVHASLIMRKEQNGGPVGINSIKDLLVTDVSFGTLYKGIVRKNFRFNTNNNSMEHLLYKIINDNSFYMLSNNDGIEKARREQYIYIIPDIIANYVASREPCDLRVVDKFLMNENMSLAVAKGSYLEKDINTTITMLQLNGVLDKLYEKWWVKRSPCHSPTFSVQFSGVSENSAYRLQNFPLSINVIHILWLIFLLLT